MTRINRKKAGIIIFLISLVFWLALFSLPFLPYKGKLLITLGTVCLVLGEVLFYLSVFLLGKEVYNRYKSKLNPKHWFMKKDGNEKFPENEENAI